MVFFGVFISGLNVVSHLAVLQKCTAYRLVVFPRSAILFELEEVAGEHYFPAYRQLWSCRSAGLLAVQLNKLVGCLPNAPGSAEFASAFFAEERKSSLAGTKTKGTLLRVQGTYVAKCTDSRRNALPKHFGYRLCIWLNLSLVSKAPPECMCSKSLLAPGLYNLREQPPSLDSYALLHLKLVNPKPTCLEQANSWVNCQFCLQLSVAYTAASLHWALVSLFSCVFCVRWSVILPIFLIGQFVFREITQFPQKEEVFTSMLEEVCVVSHRRGFFLI